MRVHHLNCGSMRPLGGKLVDGNPGYLRSARLVCHCLLIEADDGLVLVDTGMGIADVTNPGATLGPEFQKAVRPVLDVEETAARQVLRMGYQLDDVRHVVVTHLDVDHAGGLRDFPGARVHVYAAELREALDPTTVRNRRRYRAAQWSHGPDWQPYEVAGDEWFGFDAVRDLKGLPEILLVPLAGHTLGHAGVAVRTAGKWLLHCGDAYFYRGEVDPDRPRCTPGLDKFQQTAQVDGAQRLANQERLRSLVREHGAEVEVFSAHDATELDRYR